MMSKERPELDELIQRAIAKYAAMTPAERAVMHDAQRRSWVRGELGMGSDADEAAYRGANPEERKQLDAEAKVRVDRSMARHDEN